VSRFTMSGNTIATSTEQLLMEFEELPSTTNHNGGALEFGADGKLYIAIGDGGTDATLSQNLNHRFGSILRINIDGSIPENNPFYNELTGDNRAIWAYGLRNPFVIDVDPVDGRLYINDVGGGSEFLASFEKVHDGKTGSNYGWPVYDGQDPEANAPDNYQPALYTYRTGGDGCAITGGSFYRAAVPLFPSAYNGDYFFGDYCNGWLRVYDADTETVSVFADELGFGLVALATGPDGALYYLQQSRLGRITYDGFDLVDDDIITPADALYVLNRAGSSDMALDFNGDGMVTGTDADEVLARIGLTP
ncbi:MAG: PQQ-dependent sugar dehydrogenase, partial [Chloroflexota bacterium]